MMLPPRADSLQSAPPSARRAARHCPPRPSTPPRSAARDSVAAAALRELPAADAQPFHSPLSSPLLLARFPHTSDALLLATGTDEAATGGVEHSQASLASVLASHIRSGAIVCDERTMGATLSDAASKAERLFEAVGVATRGSRTSPESFFDPDTSQPGGCAARLLLPRLDAAARAALSSLASSVGCSPSDAAAAVTHLVVGSLTAPRCSPGPDVGLARSLGLKRSVRRTALHHLGCLGGLRSLAVAADIARSDSFAVVLVVYGDVSSLIGASLPSPLTEADLLSIAIFTDGAAAAVVGGSAAGVPAAGGRFGRERAVASGSSPLARILVSRSQLVLTPNGGHTADDMWMVERGYRPDGALWGENFVSKAVPKHLLRSLPPFVASLLSSAQSVDAAFPRCVDDLDVLCHPGGPAVLDAAARALRLGPSALDASWGVLKARGNMSGATNLFCVHGWARSAGSGRRALGLAFGPGMAVEGVALQKL